MKMTRQHFEEIAHTMNGNNPGKPIPAYSAKAKIAAQAAYDQWVESVKALAAMCARSNGGFDRTRFFKACGMEE